MAEILPRHYLFGVIILMFFVIGGVGIMSEYMAYDNGFDTRNSTTEFNRTFNKIANVEDSIDSLENQIRNDEDADFGFFGVLNSLINSAWTALRLMFQSFTFMDAVFEGMTAFFGIPSWIPLIIGLLITVVLVFGIYSLIFQKDG